MTETLDELLERLQQNPHVKIEKKTLEVIEIDNGGLPVAKINVTEKELTFYDEYMQTAYSNPELRPLIDYAKHENYDMNID